MSNTQTKKTTYYLRALVALATLAMMASLLAVTAARPASASTTFTVNTALDLKDVDIYDGHCDVYAFFAGDQCTLRAAIQQANSTKGADTIKFGLAGTGVHTISPASALPKIWYPVTIDGYTQLGAFQNTLANGTNAKPTIQIDGSQAGQSADGLYIDSYTGSPGVVVRGLVINRFHNGIVVADHTTNSRIEGNFIGTDPSGTKDLGNRYMGVMLSPTMANSSNVVGGSTPAARNLISGNAGYGVDLESEGTHVSGNLIGTQRDGKSPLGNDWGGVYMEGYEDTLGGDTPSHANTIAFNGGDGVATGGHGGILSNSIFSNGGLGIDLYGTDGPTANDAGDVDGLQNKPSLHSAKTVSGKTTIKGTLNSRVGFGYTVQFFSNPPGTDEGARPIGQKTHVSVDGTGHASFTLSPSSAVAVGQTITATATNENTLETSEFSAPRTVTSS